MCTLSPSDANFALQLTMLLPFSQMSRFGELFRALDADKDKLGYEQYSLETTSLEEGMNKFIALHRSDVIFSVFGGHVASFSSGKLHRRSDRCAACDGAVVRR